MANSAFSPNASDVDISGKVEDTSPAHDADFAVVYDASANVNKKVKLMNLRGLTLAAEQASTSGTAIAFTGIPSGVKQIVVMLDGVSTNGTSGFGVQIGDSGGLETSGYASGNAGVTAANAAFGNAGGGASFNTSGLTSAAHAAYGSFILTLQDSANNVWCAQWGLYFDDTTDNTQLGAGRKALTATLDRVSVISADTFDAGAISIAYA